MKKRSKSPTRTSASSLLLARVMEPNPATAIASMRSMTRMTPNSRSRCRSRSWRMIPFLLFPVIESLACVPVNDDLPLPDFLFDLISPARPTSATAGIEIGGVDLWFGERGDPRFLPPRVAGLHDHVAAGE